MTRGPTTVSARSALHDERRTILLIRHNRHANPRRKRTTWSRCRTRHLVRGHGQQTDSSPAFSTSHRRHELFFLRKVAPQAGLEPATLRLTAGCSAIELPRNIGRLPAKREEPQSYAKTAPAGNGKVRSPSAVLAALEAWKCPVFLDTGFNHTVTPKRAS